MKTCAAFTMARNEPLWLNVWLSHYSEELGEENCWVICEPVDETIDEAKSKFPNANFHVEPSPKPGKQSTGFYDGTLELWRLNIVKRWQRHLLSSYKCVIFGDTDEMLIPEQGIIKYCEDVFIPSGKDRVRSECWTPVQQVDYEPPVERTSGISTLCNRTKMWRLPTYDKTLLVRTPQTYSKGFHITYGFDGTGKLLNTGERARGEDFVDPEVPVIHAWRIDFDDWYQDAKWRYGGQNGLALDEALEYFRTHQHPKIVDPHNPHVFGEVVTVPEAWKKKLVFR